MNFKLFGVKDKNEIKRRVEYVLEKVNMYKHRNRFASMLSGGERQKTVMDCDDEKLGEYNEKFGTVLKYIDSNYMYDITLEQLADVAGYSKYHFSRIFKQYNSMSYLQYINARRTKAAETLLLDPDMPITEVAMRSGFKSLTTFNRIFKEIKHCTPTDFKKLYSTTH